MNYFVSFFDENIKKSQRAEQLYFLGKLNLIVHTVKITKKYVNRGGICKSSKAIVNIATKELWLMVQGRTFDCFINYIFFVSFFDEIKKARELCNGQRGEQSGMALTKADY